ncbi:MAG TPA: BamA/TamA family outer membrane protein [Acetobacteraceae bacterium]|nr:BamA/TamA family outer membrane protein [Acetobacteraceae bacterium]
MAAWAGRVEHSVRLRDPTARVLVLACLLALLVIMPPPAAAQEPPVLPYTVEIAPSGDEALDAAVRALSQLVRLREQAPTSAFGVVGRARGDLDRLQAALQSEGYYAGAVRIEIAGEPADAPGLAERIEGRQDPVPIRITLSRGPQYRIGRIAITADSVAAAQAVAEAAAPPFGLALGDPARAAPVLDASETLLDRLRRAGHPLAVLASRDVVVDHERRSMEVGWRFAPGPRARFAAPVVTGAERTDQDLLNRLAARRLEGQDYSPQRLERARRALLGLGVFATVRADPAAALDPAGDLPVTFVVSERPLHAIGINIAYETNFGPAGRVYWEHRNLFGGAERLRLEGEVSRLGEGGGAEDVNYRAFATLRTPELFRRDLQTVTRIGAVRERLEAYDRDAVLASFLVERPVTEHLVLQAGPGYEAGRVGRYGIWDDFQLLSFTLGARWDNTDSLLDPRRGWRAAVTATPYLALGEGTSFTRVLAIASTYWDISGDGRSVLALRGALGSALGAARDEITLDKRFYAGGGGSVRGFPYLSIGPRDAFNRPLGGVSLVEGSLEFRQRIRGDWGAVAFVDAGSVGTRSLPDLSDVRVGVGVGVRYRTALGPIRLDVAVPLNREPGGPAYGLYVGIGQAF